MDRGNGRERLREVVNVPTLISVARMFMSLWAIDLIFTVFDDKIKVS